MDTEGFPSESSRGIVHEKRLSNQCCKMIHAERQQFEATSKTVYTDLK